MNLALVEVEGVKHLYYCDCDYDYYEVSKGSCFWICFDSCTVQGYEHSNPLQSYLLTLLASKKKNRMYNQRIELKLIGLD